MWNSTLVMTGFGIDWDTGLFQFHASDHHRGKVKVLGWSSKNATGSGGLELGNAYLSYLAHHPATARRIARKLCLRFVSDDPPSGLVNMLADTYLANDTAIVPVLRKLFRSQTFKNSVGQKVRRPLEDLTATLRILGYRPDPKGTQGLEGLYWIAQSLGQAPMGWHPPDGYPDAGEAWRSAGGTLERWNTHMSLAAHWWPDSLGQPDLRDHLLPAKLPATHGALIDALAKALVYRKLSVAHRAVVLDFLGRKSSDPVTSSSAAVGWRLPYVVALILDSPYHEVR
jgi:uncharacterized protein (DUF1800 family)